MPARSGGPLHRKHSIAAMYEPLFTSIPVDRHECWSRLQKFIDFWMGVACPRSEDTQAVREVETRLNFTLPAALAEWQTQFRPWIGQCGKGQFMVPADQLRIQDDLLVVRSQAVFNGLLEAVWGTPLTELDSHDPPVVIRLRDREYPCAARFSQFAVFGTVFDALDSNQNSYAETDLASQLPEDAQRMEFPPTFGIIDTAVYEGTNWVALLSSTCYLRRRIPETSGDEFLKYELSGAVPL